MTTITQVITALPTAPDPATMTRDEFSVAAAAFVLAQKDTLQPEINTWAGQVNTVKGEMAADAATATTQAGNAAASAVAAANQVTLAAAQVTLATNQANAAAASALTAINAPGTSATSSTSLTIASGVQNLTIQTGKAFSVGQSVTVAYTTMPYKRMGGVITAYDSGTGALTVNVDQIADSGTFSNWTVSLGALSAAGLGGNTFTGDQNLSGHRLIDALITDCAYALDNDGNISGGTWAIDYANGPVIKATATAAITSITMSNWPASGTAGHLRLMLSAGSYSVTFPAWKWIKSDLTTTTTFADLGLTLPSANPVIIDLFSDDGGTTMYATVGRN